MWLQPFFPATGELRFDRFMELALYDPQHGYYCSQLSAIGPRGDFSTSATLSDSLALAIAAWTRSHRARHLIEIGAGTGQLARAILKNLGAFGMTRRLGLPVPKPSPPTYHIVERSPLLADAQRKLLGRSVRWHPSVEDALLAAGGKASIFSNELVDAFPVRIFQKGEAWSELHLRLHDRQLVEAFLPAQDLPDSSLFEREWPDGQRIEIHQSYRRWLATWLPAWQAGEMLTIDYGAPAADLYQRTPAGSLRAYYRHQRQSVPELYSLAGRKDLTADVNFDDLVRWGDQCGLLTASLTTQAEFLLPHLDQSRLTDSERFLTDPDGAGNAFMVLRQRRE